MGCHLWNLTGDNATSKSSRSLLPVLTILFLVSYGLLTMLVVEQGRTIDSQRSLIHLLFSDSVQLSSIKGKADPETAERCSGSGAGPGAEEIAAGAAGTVRSPDAITFDPQPQAGAKNQSTSKFGDRFRRSLRRTPLTRETIAGR